MLVLLETLHCPPAFPNGAVCQFRDVTGILQDCYGQLWCTEMFCFCAACGIPCWCALICVSAPYRLRLLIAKEIKKFPLISFSVFLPTNWMIAINSIILVMPGRSLSCLRTKGWAEVHHPQALILQATGMCSSADQAGATWCLHWEQRV